MTTVKSFSPNEAQQKAIDTINGPVMLLAGPGTGKTYTLIKRIEKMLSAGISPESILCLTFSDAASCEMSNRLIKSAGIEAAGVNISTYHSFCNEIIKQNPAEFEMAQNIQMADDITKQAVLKESIDEYSKEQEIEFLKDKWGNKYFYIPSIISAIETIKRERTTSEEYFDFLNNNEEWQPKLDALNLELEERKEKNKVTKTILSNIESQEKKIGKAKEFYSIFKIYEKKLAQNSLIDFSDMINFVLNKMEEDETFLQNAVSGYKYILVDEYQDTSKVQNELIFNILRGAKTDNIFVVGDDDQIIYSFQGARSKNLTDFLEKFKNTKVICLTENRRSSQTILDFAENLIKPDKFRISNCSNISITKKLTAKNPDVIEKDSKIKFDIYTETIEENNAIIEKIEKLINEGIKMSEIAILARRNDTLENFARLLKQKNIPFILSRQKDAFEIPAFIVFYFYIKILVNSYIEEDKLFGLLSNKPFKIKDKSMAELLRLQRKTGKKYLELLSNVEFENEDEIQDFLAVYHELKAKKSYKPLVPFLYEIATKSGILGFYANCDTEQFENISSIQRLIDEAKSYSLLHKGALLEDFVSHLDTYFKENIKIGLKKETTNKNAVQLVTYHGSKGREFEYVFMPDLTSKAFEKSSSGSRELSIPVQKSVFSEDKDENKDAELIRLLFVGVTRAKFGLNLSYAGASDGKTQTSTKYISNMFPEADNYIEKTFYEQNSANIINEIIKDIHCQFIKDEYKLELQKRIQDIIISQTSLNQYLNCPLNYFYSNVLNVPVYIEDTDILSYGTSIHKAIDLMTKEAVKQGYWGKIEDMKAHFINKMNELEFSTQEKKEEHLKRGETSIENNFPKLTERTPANIISTEYRMELDYGGVQLKGFADRVSKDSDGNIEIYDFKTGSYKKVSNNENYYNQLRFYKFLYETLNEGKKVAETALVFFEEGCKTSSAGVDLSNNEEIKAKINQVITGIKNLEFEPDPSAENCKYCAYRAICKLNCHNS